MKDYKSLAKSIVEYIGGEENVLHLEHCSTRLRFTLKDNKKVRQDELKAVKGVMGVIMAGQCQVVIGNDVIEVYDEVMKLGNFGGGSVPDDEAAEKKKIGEVVFDFIVGVFQPLIPAIAGAGILKALLTLLTLIGVMSSDGSAYRIFYNAADAVFYFLPILVAMTTASKLKCNKLVAVSAVSVLVLPAMTSMMAEGVSLFGFQVQNITYSTQVFPAILSVMFLSVIEKYFTKICPKPVRVFMVPLVCMVITVPVTLLILGPIGYDIGAIFTSLILTLYNTFGWVAVALLAAVLPFMIATGMHKAFVPYAVSSITEIGYEVLYLSASLAHNISESGACFAVALRSKDEDVRSTALSAGISALFGITEPALYGVTLQNKRALKGVVAGSFISGVVIGLAGIKAFVAMGPGLAGMAMYVDPDNSMNIVWAFVGFAVALLSSFIITLVIYKEDGEKEKTLEASPAPENNGAGNGASPSPENQAAENRDDESAVTKTGTVLGSSEDTQKKECAGGCAEEIIASPLSGKAITLSEVKDEVFRTGVLGDGVAVIPDGNVLCAPCDGVISTVTETKHAVGMETAHGAEILMHIGMDTVQLGGEGFELLVKQGDTVKQGQPLVKFDSELITKKGFELTTPVVVLNTDDFPIRHKTAGQVAQGDRLMSLEVR